MVVPVTHVLSHCLNVPVLATLPAPATSLVPPSYDPSAWCPFDLLLHPTLKLTQTPAVPRGFSSQHPLPPLLLE